MCQGFGHFSVFLHHFVVPKLATSGIRVKESSFITVDLCDELLILTESGWPLHLIQPAVPGAPPYLTLPSDTCPASEKHNNKRLVISQHVREPPPKQFITAAARFHSKRTHQELVS